MDIELNATHLIIDGYVELQQYRYIYCVIMFTVYVLIICSNSTIVCLIVSHKNLHEPMYIFIAALLLNSVLYSTTIYPKILIDILSEKQSISYPLCLFQCFVYYTMVGSEFLLLTFMAYDRYVSICKPLQYSTIMTKTSVSVFLVLAWIVPVCELTGSAVIYANAKLCGFTLKGIFCNNSVYTLLCVRSLTLSISSVFMLLNIALFPMMFILFTYTRIFIVSYRNSKTVRGKAAQTCLPHLLILLSLSCFVTYDVIVVRLESDFPKLARLIMTLQMIAYHPLFNPIIYGLKMKEISKHLSRFLKHIKFNK